MSPQRPVWSGTWGCRRPKSRASFAQTGISKAAVRFCSLLVGYRAYHGAGSLTGNEKRNTVPCGAFAAAERRPPCASMIERLIDKPMPSPSALDGIATP